jgi:hypothetical protein
MRTAAVFALALAGWMTIAEPALAQLSSCGEPPIVQDGSIKGEIDSKASFLKTLVGDVALKGQVDIAKNDVLQRYPNADQLRLKQYFLYVVCLQIMNDTKLGTLEKIKAFRDASDVVFPPKSERQGPESSFSMQATFTVCVVDQASRCPKGAVWYSCPSYTIYGALKATCTSFRQAILASEPGGQCGLMVSQVVCSVSSPM